MPCPSECSNCPQLLHVTLTGFSDACGFLNGGYTFNRVGNNCIWSGLPAVWGFIACRDNKWGVSIGNGVDGAYGELPNETGCPTEGTYYLTAMGACTGQNPKAFVTSQT